MNKLISVVICTYNRAELLQVILQSLCQQTLERSLYEIVIVDNNSTDNTRDVVEKFSHYHNVRYCFEPRQGLSHARNHGWQAARGEYVTYFDDECKIPEQWLSLAKKVIDEVAPAVFGGPLLPFYNTPKPIWFKDLYHRCYDLDVRARALSGEDEYLCGSNITFRRTLLETLGGFDPKYGMSGQKIAFGEETVVQKLMRDRLPDQIIYFDPKLNVYDLVRPEKMRLRWLIKQRFASGRYTYLVFSNNDSFIKVLAKLVLRVLVLGLDIGRSVVLRNHKQYPYIQNYLYESTLYQVHKLGYTYEEIISYINQKLTFVRSHI